MVDHVKRIQSTIVDKPPFYKSTFTVPDENALTKFCYFTKNRVNCLDLLNLSNEDIKGLSDASDPATFGRNQEDVLDPTYRKALKMDKSSFCTNFELKQDDIGLDILEEIKDNLLDEIVYSTDAPKNLRAEIYKLNIYGKDSFFKKHKDTPRGLSMVGSLVIAFPTPECKGGELTLSQGDEFWTWDSAAILRDSPPRTFAYVAFYGDVDHEVSVITEGNRVTLTYNLYLDKHFGRGAEKNTPTTEEAAFEKALSDALNDRAFLPSGGYIAFGLQYMYPINPDKTKLHHLIDKLKGRDAMTRRVCARLGLKVQLKAVYKNIRYLRGKADFALDSVYGTRALSECLYDQKESVLHVMNRPKMIQKIGAGDIVSDSSSSSSEDEGEDEGGDTRPEADGEDAKMNLDSNDAGSEDDSDEEPEAEFTDSEMDTDTEYESSVGDAYDDPSAIRVLWINEKAAGSGFKTPYIAYGNEANLEYVYAYICLMAFVQKAKKRSVD